MGYSGQRGGGGTPSTSTTKNSGFHGYSPIAPAVLNNTTPETPAKSTVASTTSGTTSSTSSVKVATSNLFVLNDIPPSIEATFSLVFESIAATELTGYLSHNMVNGQNAKSEVFTNFTGLLKQYNPLSIIHVNGTPAQYASNFNYNLENFVPSVGSGTNGEIAYLTSTTSNQITIDFINTGENERVEVEFVTFDGLKNATIYV